MIMCVLLCYPVSIRIYYQQGVLFLVSTKFLTHRVSLQSSHFNFQNIFVLPTMAAILNFLIFRKKMLNTKMLIS